jgi:hypothetical protein
MCRSISNRTPGAQRFILNGINQFDADLLTMTKMFFKNFSPIRSAHYDSANSSLTSKCYLVFSAGVPSNWQHRLRRRDRKWAQTCSLATN